MNLLKNKFQKWLHEQGYYKVKYVWHKDNKIVSGAHLCKKLKEFKDLYNHV